MCGIILHGFQTVGVTNVTVKNIRSWTNDREAFGINIATALTGCPNRANIITCIVYGGSFGNGGYGSGIVIGTKYDGFSGWWHDVVHQTNRANFSLNNISNYNIVYNTFTNADSYMKTNTIENLHAGYVYGNIVSNLNGAIAFGTAYASRVLFYFNDALDVDIAFNCDTDEMTYTNSNPEIQFNNEEVYLADNWIRRCMQGFALGGTGCAMGNGSTNSTGAVLYLNNLEDMVYDVSTDNIAFMLNGNTHNITITNNTVSMRTNNLSPQFAGVVQGNHGTGKVRVQDAQHDNNNNVIMNNNTFSIIPGCIWTNRVWKSDGETTGATNNTPAIPIVLE